jgi:hypothetical protein
MNAADLAWKGVALGAGAASAMVTRKILRATWRGVSGQDPPVNPASPDTGWREAVVWAVGSAVALGVTRLVAQRGAAAAWKASTGEYPKALEAVS